MTAIAGVIAFDGEDDLENLCRAGIRSQSSYGGGRVTSEAVPHAAMAIDLWPTVAQDLFDRQPLCADRFLMVADVRLDNRQELIDQLRLEPAEFAGRADADILLQAWLRWDEGCLDRIIGDFALAVYDRKHRRLSLARDVTGARPLCFATVGSTLCFASMPSGAVAPGMLRPDLGSLSILLADPPLTSDRTCFETVRAVQPGELVKFSPEGLSRRRYWNPVLSPQDRPFAAAVEEFRERLDDAVASRMRRCGHPLAIQLSSGLDSSAVAGTAARLRVAEDRLVAFTSAPSAGLMQLRLRGRIADESAIAARTASTLGIEHVVIRDASPLLDALRGHSRYYQEPVANMFNLGWWTRMSLAARDMGASVMLTGSLGNFGISYGGLGVLAHWLRQGQWLRWFREARASIANNDVRWRGVLAASLDPWTPAPVWRAASRVFGMPWMEGRGQFVRREMIRKSDHPSFPFTGNPAEDRLSLIRSLDFGQQLKGLLGQTGIEERDPTADRRLIEFCLSMPPEQLLDKGTYKQVARSALADRVPAEVLQQRARGYQAADWCSRLHVPDMLAIVEEISASGARELLDLAAIGQAIENWPTVRSRGGAGEIIAAGRALTNALAVGQFIRDIERDPGLIGVGTHASSIQADSSLRNHCRR